MFLWEFRCLESKVLWRKTPYGLVARKGERGAEAPKVPVGKRIECLKNSSGWRFERLPFFSLWMANAQNINCCFTYGVPAALLSVGLPFYFISYFIPSRFVWGSPRPPLFSGEKKNTAIRDIGPCTDYALALERWESGHTHVGGSWTPLTQTGKTSVDHPPYERHRTSI